MFLELVALGNIRRALEMFQAFLTAGSLETNKIIHCMKNNDEYLVPIHEFIKSVMLGSKRYYAERTSDILNLFAIGDIERPSHFTRYRLLQFLYERRHEATPFGTGFVPIPESVHRFNQIGITKKDFLASLSRLTEGALVENDLLSQQLTEDAQVIRITPSGRYYLHHLYKMFAYVDLVMQDTPIFNGDVFGNLAYMCESTDMYLRFQRCEIFLNYLEEQEKEELITIEKLDPDGTWNKGIVPNMKLYFSATQKIISDKGIT